jgi:hypothetical protein
VKTFAVICRISLLLAVSVLSILLFGQEQKQSPDKNFYENSLHYSNQGLQHWYAKENGGLERITGIPFSTLTGCNKCHVRSCDTCHAQDSKNGTVSYSTAVARSEAACEKCHGIESQEFARKNPGDPTADVHFARGMKCMDCHSIREVHGDGTPYASMQSPGALDVRCENCHKDLSKCPSNAVHGGKVDCTACHVREISSCYNCHFEKRVAEGKSLSLPLKGSLFLINHEGKVTLGNLHTFIYQNKTMITFAPAFPHSIMKKGRTCEECHGTPIVRQVQAGSFVPVRWENAALKNANGIIPVVDGYNWRFPFLDYADGKWIPAEHAAQPLLNYAGYAKPLTREQLSKMAQPQKR